MENQNSPDEPHVQIFGHDVDDRDECCGKNKWHRHRRSGGWGFGLLLVFIGVILLLNNLGIVSWDFWNYVWPVWPLLLVLIGLRIVFGRGWVGNVIILIITLAIIAFVTINALNRINSPWMRYVPGQTNESNINLGSGASQRTFDYPYTPNRP